MTRRDQRNASWPTKQGATAWAKLNRSSLNLTRIASRSPLSVSITERASLPSINTTATSPGVIHFHERVFDARPHFYERLFRDFRTFMSEFETKRPGLTITPVKCSQHLTGCQTAERTLRHRKPAKRYEHFAGSDKFGFRSRRSHPTHAFRKRHPLGRISGPRGS